MNRRGRSLPSGLLLFAVVSATEACLVACAAAQIVIQGPVRVVGAQQSSSTGETREELADNVFPKASREVVRYLSAARKLFEQGDHDQAAWILQREIINPAKPADGQRRDQDYFVQPDPNQPQLHRSLRYEAQQLIGRMSEAYESRYGAEARVMLQGAVSSGDPARLGDVSRVFFHTQAGYTATFLLGLHHLDHGRPLAGALTLQRLSEADQQAGRFEPTLSLAAATCWLQAGMPEKAAKRLLALKEAFSGELIEIAGKPVKWFSETDEAATWLVGLVGTQTAPAPTTTDQWTMFRGDASRNATCSGGAPLLSVRWRVPVTDDPMTEDVLQQLRLGYEEQNTPPLLGLHPLVVDDLVLMRTVRNLLAVDLTTGKRLWEVPVDDPVQASLARYTTSRIPTPTTRQQPVQIAVGLSHRVREDATFGTLSSDGRYVFSVEDLKMGVDMSRAAQRIFIAGINRTSSPGRPYNRLAAFDLRTEGKLKWELGGPADQYRLRLAETYFLGPPLPMRGQLYVLAEIKNEVSLLVLDAETGDLIWSQPLATVAEDALGDPWRRSAGVSPSYADGILVCPTSAGAVVGVELATRSLLWGYRYTRPTVSSRHQALIRMQMMRSGRMQSSAHWADGAACIADGRVLVTPTESDALYCLNLIDGTPAWEQPLPRGDSLYLACVHQGNVILVGKNEVRAVRLSDGKPAWGDKAVVLPEGAMPSGRGFAAKDRYFLPLSTAEVASIDLIQGKITQTSKSRKGTVPGNLICCRGRMISQGFDGLEAYSLLDSVRENVSERLAAKPDDPEALAKRGEILLDQGQRTEAISCFRHAYELDEDPRTRGLLRDALLDVLRADFAGHRDRAGEIELLLDTPAHRATFLRLMASGLKVAGEGRAAFDRYLELVDLDADSPAMDQISNTLSVRRDRWIRVQLAALRSESDEQTRRAIAAEIEKRLGAAVKTADRDALGRYFDFFRDDPTAVEARDELIERSRSSGNLLQTEFLLWPRQESSDPAVAGAAVAELAELFRQRKRPADAAACYARLGDEFAEVVCREGKTGRQLLESLPEDDPVRKEIDGQVHWPVGLVEEKKAKRTTRSSTSGYGRYSLGYRGNPGPFLGKTTVRFDQSRRMIRGYDGLGKQLWEVSAIKSGGTNRTVPYYAGSAHARVRGHLLVVSTGSNVLAINTLEPDGAGKPVLLWNQDLIDASSAAIASSNRVILQGQIVVWGGGFSPYGYQSGGGGLGPLTDRYVCFQCSTRLVAADPLSGNPYWVRRGIPRGCELFGDDELIFALPNDKEEALVFRALDGKSLGRRKIVRSQSTQILPDGTRRKIYIPLGQSCLTVSGRYLLRWKSAGAKRVLELFDPWEQKPVWELKEFSSSARVRMLGHDAVAVLEPDGRFALLSVDEGKLIVEATLEQQAGLSEFFLFRWEDGYLLVTHAPLPNVVQRVPTSPMPGTSSRQITRGRVYALDGQGKLLWPTPAEVKNQYLLLDQPPELPAMVFACQVYQQNRDPRGRYKRSILCIDKRTGRRVYGQDDFSNSTSVFQLTGNPETHTINVRMRQSDIALTFTDKPMPPPSETDEEEPGAKTTGGALLNALRKVLGEPLKNAAENQGRMIIPQFVPPVRPPPVELPLPLPAAPPPR